MALAVSIILQVEETTEEQPTQQQVESLVRDGQVLSSMILWGNTTTVGTWLGVMRVKFGATPTILVLNGESAQFLSVLL